MRVSVAGDLLASRGLKVSVLEAHYEIGGCAHKFSVGLDGRTVPTAKLRTEPDTPVFKYAPPPSETPSAAAIQSLWCLCPTFVPGGREMDRLG